MFYGKWSISIDYKWRMIIPTAVLKYFKDKVILYEKDDSVRIERFEKKKNRAQLIHLCEIKKNGKILIPKHLRNSPSFYFGRKIILVGKEDYLEIWPRP